MKIRRLHWRTDARQLLDFDASYATSCIYQVVASELGFRLEPQTLSSAFHKTYDASVFDEHIEGAEFAIVAEADDGRIEGFATVVLQAWNRRAELGALFVAPASKRRGIGSRLMSAVETFARSKDVRHLWLETQTTNLPAIDFYRHHGFQLAGLDVSLYDPRDVEPHEIAVFFCKPL